MGAKVYLGGNSIEEAFEAAREFCKKENAYFIHPFNDENIIYGQATCALEAHQQLTEDPDYFICSIGGGGLAAGACLYFTTEGKGKTKVIGVEQELYNSALRSIEQNKLVAMDPVEHPSTIADGIAVKIIGALVLPHLLGAVEQVVSVSEHEIYHAIAKIYKNENMIVEGAGATAVAALLKNPMRYQNKTSIVCISGKNIDNNVFQKVLQYTKEKT